MVKQIISIILVQLPLPSYLHSHKFPLFYATILAKVEHLGARSSTFWTINCFISKGTHRGVLIYFQEAVFSTRTSIRTHLADFWVSHFIPSGNQEEDQLELKALIDFWVSHLDWNLLLDFRRLSKAYFSSRVDIFPQGKMELSTLHQFHQSVFSFIPAFI